MRNTEDWIKEKVYSYNENAKEALEDMLVTTNDVMLQYKNNPTSYI